MLGGLLYLAGGTLLLFLDAGNLWLRAAFVCWSYASAIRYLAQPRFGPEMAIRWWAGGAVQASVLGGIGSAVAGGPLGWLGVFVCCWLGSRAAWVLQMPMRPTLVLALLVSTLSCSSGQQSAGHAPTVEEAAALATVQRFFDTMTSKDVAGASAVLDPEGDFVSVRWNDAGQRVVRRSSGRAYLDGLASEPKTLLERMWEPDVQVHGPIATVRTPYDFHIDGVFSHCGVDVFQLLQTDGKWIITGGTYTVERTGCSESPLGPPGK